MFQPHLSRQPLLNTRHNQFSTIHFGLIHNLSLAWQKTKDKREVKTYFTPSENEFIETIKSHMEPQDLILISQVGSWESDKESFFWVTDEDIKPVEQLLKMVDTLTKQKHTSASALFSHLLSYISHHSQKSHSYAETNINYTTGFKVIRQGQFDKEC